MQSVSQVSLVSRPLVFRKLEIIKSQFIAFIQRIHLNKCVFKSFLKATTETAELIFSGSVENCVWSLMYLVGL